MTVSEHGILAPAWAATDAGCLVDDVALLAAMVAVEVALAGAQAELGVIPQSAARAIETAAGSATIDPDVVAAGVRETANPVVAFVAQFTAAVAAVDESAAEYVHRGGTSQDILDTALLLLASTCLRRVERDLLTCAENLAALAQRHRDLPMAGRTLTQHAVPVTFGLRAATWLHGVLDARERVLRVRTGLPVSIGGAAGTLAAYHAYAVDAGDADDRTLRLPSLVARRLGLAEQVLPWHGVRTPTADLASALLVTTGALGKFAADVLVLSRTEIGEVGEEAAPGRGASSAMPQKRNPVFATLLATAARQLPPIATVLFQAMIVEDERSAGGWHAEWQPLRDCLRIAVGAAANAVRLTEVLTVAPDRITANLALTHGAIVSERVTAALAPLLGKAAAKRLLAHACANAARAGLDLADVLTIAVREAGLSVPDLAGLLDPAGYLGIAGRLVDRALARLDDVVQEGQ